MSRKSKGKKSNGKSRAAVSYLKSPHGKISPCHKNHPEISLGGGIIRGGSCSYPKADYDIYVGLDQSMTTQYPQYPWHHQSDKVEFLFLITDMAAPSCTIEFQNLLDYLQAQLLLGKRVHIGCIGGHGRTGTVLAALYHQITGDTDAIQWVREHYCDRAVESTAQIDFLVKQYGVSAIDATKTIQHSNWTNDWKNDWASWDASLTQNTQSRTVRHVKTGSSIWELTN